MARTIVSTAVGAIAAYVAVQVFRGAMGFTRSDSAAEAVALAVQDLRSSSDTASA